LAMLSTDPSTSAIRTLSLHDALPILIPDLLLQTSKLLIPIPQIFSQNSRRLPPVRRRLLHEARLLSLLRIFQEVQKRLPSLFLPDRKSTRLNSSHVSISYAVFCLKKK